MRELAALAASLGEGLAPGYVLRGKERWFRRRGLELLRAEAQRQGLEVHAHSGRDPDFELAALLDDLSGAGLFAQRQLIVASAVDEELKTVAQRESALTRAVRAFCQSADAGTVVVVSEGLRADHAVSKAVVGAGGRVVDCRKLWDTPPPWQPDPRRVELVRWILERARDEGLELSAEQGLALAAAKGNDLFALEAEIVRAAQSGDGLGTQVESTATGIPWVVADDLVAGRLAEAMVGCQRLFSAGFASSSGKREVGQDVLLGMTIPAIVKGAYQMAALSESLAAGESPEGLSGPPARRKRAEDVARLRSPAEWRALLEDAIRLETRQKVHTSVCRDDLTRFALRWRVRRRPSGRAR